MLDAIKNYLAALFVFFVSGMATIAVIVPMIYLTFWTCSLPVWLYERFSQRKAKP